MRPLLATLAISVSLALAFTVGVALRPTLFPTASSESGVVPSVIGLHGRAALRMLIADRFGVLPVPTVPSSRRQFDLAVVYKQFPTAGTKVSRRLITIYARTS